MNIKIVVEDSTSHAQDVHGALLRLSQSGFQEVIEVLRNL